MYDVLVAGVVEVDDVAVEELLVDEVEVLDDGVDVEDVDVEVLLVDEVELEDVVVDEMHEVAGKVEVLGCAAATRH